MLDQHLEFLFFYFGFIQSFVLKISAGIETENVDTRYARHVNLRVSYNFCWRG